MKFKTWDRILFLCIGIIIGFSLVLLFAFIIDNDIHKISEENMKIAESEKEIVEDCKNMSLINTSICINSYISDMFFYNTNNTNVSIKDMSFERLKNEGGVCRHWNFYIEKIGEELGFSSEHVTFLPKMKHGFSVLYDHQNNAYCVLDMNRLLGCINLK